MGPTSLGFARLGGGAFKDSELQWSPELFHPGLYRSNRGRQNDRVKYAQMPNFRAKRWWSHQLDYRSGRDRCRETVKKMRGWRFCDGSRQPRSRNCPVLPL